MAVRTILRAGALAILCCENVESFSRSMQTSFLVPSFVNGFRSTTTGAISRKRQRGCSQHTSAPCSGAAATPTSVVAVSGAGAGSFLAHSDGRSAWLTASARGGRRRCKLAAPAYGIATVRMGIEFNPPEWNDLVHGFAQAVLLGIMGGAVPKLTRERIREKEAGLEVDERFEMGIGAEDEDEFGYAEGYVCATCDNTNEVNCSQCRGKGFFVSESALPKKCGYCAGLGTLECPECDERREMLQRERSRRRPPLRLPPNTDDDFPFGR